MTNEAQQIEIAKICGWEVDNALNERPYWIKNGEWKLLEQLPNYLNDLNAMHEVEKVLQKGSQWCTYYFTLKSITDATAEAGWINNGVVTATAAQRAEAFLRTLNLWNDTK